MNEENSIPHSTEARYPIQVAGFREIIEIMYKVHLEKNRDYSPSNINGMGEMGLATRTWDKAIRLMNLARFHIKAEFESFVGEQDAANEPIEDNLIDLANYAIIWLLYRRKQWAK